MLRRSIPALGLLALLLALGPPAGRPALGPGAGQGHDAAAEKHEASPPGRRGARAGGRERTADGETPNIMEPQSPLAIWTLVVFLGLMLVLGRFAWKPLIKALHEREAHLEQVLLDSEKARNEAEALAAQHRRELAQAADQVRALIEEARKEAQVSADSILRRPRPRPRPPASGPSARSPAPATRP